MKKLKYWKYCLIIVSIVLVSIQIQAQNGWTHITDMPTPRGGATANVVDGKIYVIGGSTAGLNDAAHNEMYDPSTDTWHTLALMPTPRGFLTSEVVNGIIYVIGGGLSATNKNEAYDPATNSWTPKADLPGPARLGMRAGVVNGIIYVVAGNYNQRDCYAYNPSTNTWETKASMPGGGGALSVTVYNGLVYTFGGSTNPIWSPVNNVYAYNPATNIWDITLTPMPTSRFELQTYLVGDKIFAVGGSQSYNTSLSTVERYNPVTDTWESLPNMPIQCSFFAGATVNNKIYVIGGTTNWINTLADIWEYDPAYVVPVEFTSFTAEALDQKVILRWITATELNNNGFEIQRRVAESDFATVGFVRGEGTTTNQKEYSYVDKELIDGKYFYRLKQIDYDGTDEYSDVIEIDVRSLNEYALEQNYPNPFNPTTTIGYVLKEKTTPKLILLNTIGEEVAVLINEEQGQGFHKVDFSASNLPSGVYFYQLKAGSFVQTKKMILMK